MKKISLALIILVIIGICVPAVSAELLTDEGSNSATFDLQSVFGSDYASVPGFRINNIQEWSGLYFVYFKTNNINSGNWDVLIANPSYNRDVTLTIGGVEVGTGTAYYNALYNTAGTITGVQIWVEIDDWHPTGYTGSHKVLVTPSSGTLFNGLKLCHAYNALPSESWPIGFYHDVSPNSYLLRGTHLARSHYYWENDIQISDEFVSLTRNLNGDTYVSTLQITSDAGYFEDTSPNDIDIPYVGSGRWNVTNPYGRIYSGNISSGAPDTQSNVVTVYVQNAQTGALIANTDLAINEYGTENWYNSTLEWGWTAVDLPAGNYEFYAFADGFTQFAPGRLTVDGDGNSLTLLLYPDELPPSAGNVTLQIWANEGNRGDGRYYGISNAEISINGNAGEGAGYSSGILTTNEQGYLNVEVPGNTSYIVYASKLGYIPGESRITVSTYSPVKVSVTLKAGTMPTSPPLTPTIQPTTPKPTQTTTTGSFIDTSAGGLANLFGTTLETGKTLLGFLVALAVGMGAAKQLRGGAPEFVVGFLGASFLGHVAGLIPVGFFVLIALLCGVYLGKTYIGGGDNGR